MLFRKLVHGVGHMVYYNGPEYSGEFVHGDREGHGNYRFPDGSRYVGRWKDER